MSRVIAIGDRKIDERGIDVGVVELLRAKLEAAERGDIVAVAVIWVDPANKVGAKSEGGSRHNLIAGTVYLQIDLAKD